MRSIEEINRDFAGMNHNCKRRASGCSYPSCDCPRDGAVPVKKMTMLAVSMTVHNPEDFVLVNERTGDRWRGADDGTMKRDFGIPEGCTPADAKEDHDVR
jgi:hypothetical protein